MEARPITNLMLLKVFRQCAHLQFHQQKRFQGQGYILVLLFEHKTLTQRELTQLTQRRSATLSEQLERMEHLGLIIREKNSFDKRHVNIRLTSKGEELAAEAKKEREETADLLFSMLEDDEKSILYQILQKMSVAWRKSAEENPDEEVQKP